MSQSSAVLYILPSSGDVQNLLLWPQHISKDIIDMQMMSPLTHRDDGDIHLSVDMKQQPKADWSHQRRLKWSCPAFVRSLWGDWGSGRVWKVAGSIPVQPRDLGEDPEAQDSLWCCVVRWWMMNGWMWSVCKVLWVVMKTREVLNKNQPIGSQLLPVSITPWTSGGHERLCGRPKRSCCWTVEEAEPFQTQDHPNPNPNP